MAILPVTAASPSGLQQQFPSRNSGMAQGKLVIMLLRWPKPGSFDAMMLWQVTGTRYLQMQVM